MFTIKWNFSRKSSRLKANRSVTDEHRVSFLFEFKSNVCYNVAQFIDFFLCVCVFGVKVQPVYPPPPPHPLLLSRHGLVFFWGGGGGGGVPFILHLKNQGVTTPWLLPYPVYLRVNKSRPPPPPLPSFSPALTKLRRRSPAVCVF